MKTILKYNVPIDDDGQTHDIPTGFKVRHVEQDPVWPQAAVWAEVDTDAPLVPIHFFITGTGHPIPEVGEIYCGTAVMGKFVWHVWLEAVL